VTALEYGLIASALAFVLIAIFASLGPPLSTIFSNVGSRL
jgi:Flp pilus assembly pilin Flp